MSTLVAANPYLFAQTGTFPAPFTFTVPNSLEVQPTAATATFDGTGAGSAFLACLSFYSQSGQLLSRVYPQKTIQAGDVAQVSYAPFPGGMTTQGGGGTAAVGVEHNGSTVGVEPNINFVDDQPGIVWTLTDDPLGQVVNIDGLAYIDVQDNGVDAAFEPTIDFVDTPTIQWAINDDGPGKRALIEASVLAPNVKTELFAQTSTVVGGGGGGVLLTWTKASGATLLDLTAPTKPKIVADGVYAFTLRIGWDQTGGSPGATYYWNAILVTDPTVTNKPIGAFYGHPHAVIGASVFQSSVTIPYTGFLAANTVLGVFVQQFSGGNLSYGFNWPNITNSVSTVQQLA